MRAVIRAIRVYISPPPPAAGQGAAAHGATGGKRLTRRKQGKKKANTIKVYRGGAPKRKQDLPEKMKNNIRNVIKSLMNEFHNQLIKYVFYLIQNLREDVDINPKINKLQIDIKVSGKITSSYSSESPTVLYNSLIHLAQMINEYEIQLRTRLSGSNVHYLE